MKFLQSPWFYVIAAIITIIGIITGKYLFIFLALPFGLFSFKKKKGDKD